METLISVIANLFGYVWNHHSSDIVVFLFGKDLKKDMKFKYEQGDQIILNPKRPSALLQEEYMWRMCIWGAILIVLDYFFYTFLFNWASSVMQLPVLPENPPLGDELVLLLVQALSMLVFPPLKLFSYSIGNIPVLRVLSMLLIIRALHNIFFKRMINQTVGYSMDSMKKRMRFMIPVSIIAAYVALMNILIICLSVTDLESNLLKGLFAAIYVGLVALIASYNMEIFQNLKKYEIIAVWSETPLGATKEKQLKNGLTIIYENGTPKTYDLETCAPFVTEDHRLIICQKDKNGEPYKLLDEPHTRLKQINLLGHVLRFQNEKWTEMKPETKKE